MSYGQACALALALDRVGTRWTLLIVRELLVGPKRFTDLKRGLPGLATNLLSSRLRDLQAEGLVQKMEILPGIETYSLTENGLALEAAVQALVRWGGQYVPSAPDRWQDNPSWLLVALPAILRPAAPTAELTCGVNIDGCELTVRWEAGQVSVRQTPVKKADVFLAADYRSILGFFAGAVPLHELRKKGAVRGRPRALKRLGVLCKHT